MDKQQVLIIAHRGAMGEAPENTLAAFELAVKQGCDAIELDVQLSADQEIVVCHDHTIDRTTNGTGAIATMTAEEMRRYDAGSWFDPKFAGERIPLLREVFERVPKHIQINVELKMIPAYESVLQQKLVELLHAYDRVGTVFVSSFDHPALVELKRIEPSVRVGLLYNHRMHHPEKYARMFESEVYSLHPNYHYFREEDIRNAHAAGLQVYPWTMNDAEKMKKYVQLGVDGIITNYPAVLKQVLQERG